MGRIRGVVGAMAVAALIALLLSACGGGGSSDGTESAGSGSGAAGSAGGGASSTKEAVLQEEVSSSEMFFAGEGGPFCEQFTAAGRKKMLGEIAKSLGIKAPCAQVMAGLAKEMGAPMKTLQHEMEELTVADVTVHGTTATVAYPNSAAVTLEESGGRWYITRGP